MLLDIHKLIKGGIMPVSGEIKVGQKQVISTDKAPAAIGPYSQGTIARFGYEKLIAVSGQLPLRPEKGGMPDSIQEQTIQALNNVKAIVEEAGSTMEQVMKVEIFYTNPDDFKAINAVYKDFFTGDCPARQAVVVAGLPHPDAKVEISAWVLAGAKTD